MEGERLLAGTEGVEVLIEHCVGRGSATQDGTEMVKDAILFDSWEFIYNSYAPTPKFCVTTVLFAPLTPSLIHRSPPRHAEARDLEESIGISLHPSHQ